MSPLFLGFISLLKPWTRTRIFERGSDWICHLNYFLRFLRRMRSAKAPSPPNSSTSSHGESRSMNDPALAVAVSGRIAKRFERQIEQANELKIAELRSNCGSPPGLGSCLAGG